MLFILLDRRFNFLLFLDEEKVLLSKTSGSAGSKQKSSSFQGIFLFTPLREIAGKYFPPRFFSLKKRNAITENLQLNLWKDQIKDYFALIIISIIIKTL